MVRWLGLLGAALLPVMGLGAAVAATSSRIDILSEDAVSGPSEAIDVSAVRPIASPSQSPADKPVPRGNPLWSVPLSALTSTQERPIFSLSRRPPPPAVAALPVEEANAPPPPKPADTPQPLVLVGAVVGEGDAIAILLDRTDQRVIRMRQGEAHGGWSLSSVLPREVTLKQGRRSEVLVLQRLDGQPAAPGAPGVAAIPSGAGSNLMTPTAGNASFAPFVPRSTPKNGESDGL